MYNWVRRQTISPLVSSTSLCDCVMVVLIVHCWYVMVGSALHCYSTSKHQLATVEEPSGHFGCYWRDWHSPVTS